MTISYSLVKWYDYCWGGVSMHNFFPVPHTADSLRILLLTPENAGFAPQLQVPLLYCALLCIASVFAIIVY